MYCPGSSSDHRLHDSMTPALDVAPYREEEDERNGDRAGVITSPKNIEALIDVQEGITLIG